MSDSSAFDGLLDDGNVPCPAPAELIVFRGRTKRLFLCGQHRGRYSGRGRVCTYRIEDEPTPTAEEGVFVGPHRVCGDVVE